MVFAIFLLRAFHFDTMFLKVQLLNLDASNLNRAQEGFIHQLHDDDECRVLFLEVSDNTIANFLWDNGTIFTLRFLLLEVFKRIATSITLFHCPTEQCARELYIIIVRTRAHAIFPYFLADRLLAF